ncbi:MAG: ATP-dependent Clp protease proteolytic subunit [Ekhidna sp.]|nr:ATP-dependent Clp protease proteolytic subunit [Ekhidna sp.]MBC6410474.1 ATP-dependent Clp protease proteolytic subunit [Ekhidna sp.]
MESFIKFYAAVNANTSIQLQRTIEQLMLQGTKSLHLLLATPGGSVHDGISIYNLLKGLPIEVSTYNFGSVDSIGVVMFCAGENRFSVPHARFLLHPVSTQFLSGQTLDEPSIEESLKLIKADQENIAKIISTTINKSVEEVQKMIHNRTTLDPDTAHKLGLVTKIKSSLVPAGSQLHSIYDQQVQQQIQFPLRGVTVNPQQGFSVPTKSYTSI